MLDNNQFYLILTLVFHRLPFWCKTHCDDGQTTLSLKANRLDLPVFLARESCSSSSLSPAFLFPLDLGTSEMLVSGYQLVTRRID